VIRPAALLVVAAAGALAAGCGGRSGVLSSNDRVFVVPAVGGDAKPLTSATDTAVGPAWSFEGKRLAFVSGKDLVVAAANGRDLARFTSPGGYYSDSAAWSRQGRLAATAVSGDEMHASVIVIHGETERIVARVRSGTADSGRGPAWSPDGRQLVYCVQGPLTPEQGGVRASGDLDVAVLAADGHVERVTKATGNEFGPSWSPDGRSIAYLTDDGLDVVPATGGQSRRLVGLAEAWGASWSPDGRLIAFTGNLPGQPRTHLFVVRADGTGLRQLTGEVEPRRPVWSPDGKLIAFATYDGSLRVIRADGSGQRVVVALAGGEIGGIAWPPGGTTIAFDARKPPPED
jgi:Tol biopolymer transport system component